MYGLHYRATVDMALTVSQTAADIPQLSNSNRDITRKQPHGDDAHTLHSLAVGELRRPLTVMEKDILMVGTSAIDRLAKELMTSTPGLKLLAARTQAKQILAERTPRTPETPLGYFDKLQTTLLNADYFTALGIDDITTWDPTPTWELAENNPRVTIPIGYARSIDPTDAGTTIQQLRLGRMAHGAIPTIAIQGATGSGLTLFTASVITALAASASPTRVAFLLCAAKSGGYHHHHLRNLPHVAGTATGLQDDPAALTRWSTALTDEINYRQDLLHAAGAKDIDHYRTLHHNDPATHPALPSLLVVVDGMTSPNPDPDSIVTTTLTTLGRRGGALGILLLITDQNLTDLTASTAARYIHAWGSMTAPSPESSAAVLTTPDAHTLDSGDILLRSTTQPTPAHLRIFKPYATDSPAVGTDQKPKLSTQIIADKLHALSITPTRNILDPHTQGNEE